MPANIVIKCAERLCFVRIRQGFYRCDQHTHELMDRLGWKRLDATPPQAGEKHDGHVVPHNLTRKRDGSYARMQG